MVDGYAERENGPQPRVASSKTDQTGMKGRRAGSTQETSHPSSSFILIA